MTKPTENELFEQWYKTTFPLDDNYDMKENAIAKQAWQARAELAEKEKAELQAEINELREALEKVIFHAEFREQDEDTARAVAIGQLIVIEELANEYLAKTPPQCLQEHDNEVIEQIAYFVSNQRNDIPACGFEFAEAIRTLKGKQNETT